jgi:hypothetical protein
MTMRRSIITTNHERTEVLALRVEKLEALVGFLKSTHRGFLFRGRVCGTDAEDAEEDQDSCPSNPAMKLLPPTMYSSTFNSNDATGMVYGSLRLMVGQLSIW